MRKIIATLGITGSVIVGGVGTTDAVINPYTDKTSHYELSVASDIHQNDKVEVSKDEPKLTVSRWNNEARISIEPLFPQAGKPSKVKRPLFSKKMEYKKGDVTAFIEPKNASEFDIDFTLDSKPSTNIFEYKVTGWGDYDFFYQPELTPEEIANGDQRPENVVGSYAVYHKTKKDNKEGKTNYGTGKIMHIYRPKVIDAKGNEIWVQLTFKDGILSVVVPQSFLDTASYPVIVDPTFGYTTIGASASQIFAVTTSNRWGQQIDAGTDSGTITTVSAAVATNGTRNVKTAIGEDDGSGSYTPMTYVERSVPSNSSVKTWYDWTYSYTMGQQATNNIYGVFIIGSGSGGGTVGTVAYDATTGVYHNTNGVTYSSNTDPLSTSGSTGRLYSIYVTYTASGGSTPDITNDLIIFE